MTTDFDYIRKLETVREEKNQRIPPKSTQLDRPHRFILAATG